MNRRGFFSACVALEERLTVVGKNYLQGGDGLVRGRQALGDSTRGCAISSGG